MGKKGNKLVLKGAGGKVKRIEGTGLQDWFELFIVVIQIIFWEKKKRERERERERERLKNVTQVIKKKHYASLFIYFLFLLKSTWKKKKQKKREIGKENGN